MTPHQLTKAFLATRGLTQTGLAARMIASKFTNRRARPRLQPRVPELTTSLLAGRWRYACAELMRYMADPAHAAYGSGGLGAEGGHAQPGGFDSQYDRNLLVYWTLWYKLSHDHDTDVDASFEPLELFQDMCQDACAYRTPVPTEFWKFYGSYDESPAYGDDVQCRDIAPLVTYGSLRQLQHRTGGSTCDGLFDEDMVNHVYCNGDDTGRAPVSSGAFFGLDYASRAAHSAYNYKRETLCDATVDLSVEDAVGNPASQTETLYDSTGATGTLLNSLLVEPSKRGESRFDAEYLSRSLMVFVYVTSSHDPGTPPGVYRLADLKVFADLACASRPSVNCGQRVATVSTTVPDVGEYVQSLSTASSLARFAQAGFSPGAVGQYPALALGGLYGLGRRLGVATSYDRSPVTINTDAEFLESYDATPHDFITGRRALLQTRCSSYLTDHVFTELPGARIRTALCVRSPYVGNAACSADDLGIVNNPTNQPTGHFNYRLRSRAEPPPPRTPPPSHRHRRRRRRRRAPFLWRSEIKAFVRDAEAEFCDSVRPLRVPTRPAHAAPSRRRSAHAGLLALEPDALRRAGGQAAAALPGEPVAARASPAAGLGAEAAAASATSAPRLAERVLPPCHHARHAQHAVRARQRVGHEQPARARRQRPRQGDAPPEAAPRALHRDHDARRAGVGARADRLAARQQPRSLHGRHGAGMPCATRRCPGSASTGCGTAPTRRPTTSGRTRTAWSRGSCSTWTRRRSSGSATCGPSRSTCRPTTAASACSAHLPAAAATATESDCCRPPASRPTPRASRWRSSSSRAGRTASPCSSTSARTPP